MPSLRPTAPSLTFLRSFSSTRHCTAKSSAKRLEAEHSAVPPYPYGPSKWYKQSNFGLYGLQKIRFGNMVSEKNEIKTRRHWRPNVLRKRLWSQSLNTFLRIRVTARVLRTIDKCGGLDEYLLGEKAQRIKELGMGGWKLRWRIMQTESVKERFRKQREELGLPPKDGVAIGSDGLAVSKEMIAEEIQKYDDELAKEADVEIVDEAEDATGEGDFMEEKHAKKGKIEL
jgi:large subunit ribosomal protein L28